MAPKDYREFTLSPLFHNFSAALLVSLNLIITSFAFAAFIFTGDLLQYLPLGLNLILFSTLLFTLFNTLFGANPKNVVTIALGVPVILQLMASQISETLMRINQPAQVLPTLLAAFALTSIFLGIAFFVLGRLKLGNLIRYIPYPVIGGITVGISWLILSMIIKSYFLPLLFDPDKILNLCAILLFGFTLLILQRKYQNPLMLFFLFFGSILLFYSFLFTFGISWKTATHHYWLEVKELSSSQHFFNIPFWLIHLNEVNLKVLLEQANTIFVAVLIPFINLPLNIVILETFLKKNMDIDAEFKSMGLGNMLCGGLGCVPEHTTLPTTLLRHLLGGKSLSVGFIVSFILGMMIIFGMTALSYIPSFATNGLLVGLSLILMAEWLYDGWSNLLKKDYFVVLAIFITMALFGLLEGIIFGILVSLILFIVDYSYVRTILASLPGNEIHTATLETRANEDTLPQCSEQIHYFKLQGFLFFGTANKLFEQIQQFLVKPNPVHFIILDCSLVDGMDSSMIFYFEKIQHQTANQKCKFIFCNLSAKIDQELETVRFFQRFSRKFILFQSLQQALEWCENQVLKERNSP